MRIPSAPATGKYLEAAWHFADSRSGRKSVMQFADRFLKNWMAEIGRDLGEGFEHKAALMEGRMGDGEIRRVYRSVSEYEDIYVDRSRAFGLGGLAAATEVLFDLPNGRKELLRHFLCLQRDRTIEEPGLVGELDGLGLVEGGDVADLT